MRNEVIYDKNGRPDIMVVFTPSELGLPDTLRGRKVKEYAISKYQNTLIDGVPYSLPFMKPAVNISHDEAIRLCEDPEGFAELAEKATDEELAKAAKLSATLAQVNAAVDIYELTAKQLKLAATTSITIKTEANDHE